MEGTELLYKYNGIGEKKYRFDTGLKSMIFEIKESVLNWDTIKELLGSIAQYKVAYKGMNVPIILLFSHEGIRLYDKLTYMMLECICYSIIKEFHTSVQIKWKPETDIFTLGVSCSPLLLLNNTKHTSVLKFPGKFEKDIYRSHYRRVVNGRQEKDSNYLGLLCTEVSSFLKFFDISDEYREEVAEVVAELVGNACEHTEADCLVDIDVTADHVKQENGKYVEGSYYGINIAIINLSEKLIGDDLKTKVIDRNMVEERYADVKNAYIIHKASFQESYGEEDFFNIAVFQDKISGRADKVYSGGTGLTLLIKTLERQSDTNMCYMQSGNRIIYFQEELLDYDKDGWIGFNKNNTFFKEIPDNECIGRSRFYLPGTAYNLHFVMKREVE